MDSEANGAVGSQLLIGDFPPKAEHDARIPAEQSPEVPLEMLPVTEESLVLRTDYSDQQVWDSVLAAIQRPVGDFSARVIVVSAPEYDGATTEQLPSLIPEGFNRSFLFVVDRVSLVHPEHPILVVDLSVSPCPTFRVIPSEMWGVENNLSLANMDFSEFADAAGEGGIFRGFANLE